MDSKTFDALTRGFGAQRSRRDAAKAFIAGLFGLGIARGASAQVGAERATCGQDCNNSSDCNAGLRCSGGICVREADSRTSCNRNINCDRVFEVCRNGRCENQSTCDRCNSTTDCPEGRACRNGRCGDCTRDSQCRNDEVCRNGRCERDRNRCNSNRDCGRKERCRNGRCKRRR
jgi:hypothetical protein